MITDIIIAAVLIVIVGSAISYICKAKRNGTKCIGCPDACSCSAKNGRCSCQSGK